jgi:hypothetical protein
LYRASVFNEKFISVDLGVYLTDAYGYSYADVNTVTYFPKSNRFEVSYNNINYTIYRNTKNCDAVNTSWSIVTIMLKRKYLDIIYIVNDCKTLNWEVI